MNTRSALFVAVVIFAGVACAKEKPKQDPRAGLAGCPCESVPVEKDNALDRVKGNWNWIETTYFSGKYGSLLKTPDNTGKRMTYTFQGDTLVISSAGEILEKTRYEIGLLNEVTQFPQDSMLIIRMLDVENSNRVALLHFCGDSIILVKSYDNLGGNVKLRKVG